MAKQETGKCPGKLYWGIIVLIIGVLYLLKDIGYDYTYGIAPWTVVFVLIGLCLIYKSQK